MHFCAFENNVFKHFGLTRKTKTKNKETRRRDLRFLLENFIMSIYRVKSFDTHDDRQNIKYKEAHEVYTKERLVCPNLGFTSYKGQFKNGLDTASTLCSGLFKHNARYR